MSFTLPDYVAAFLNVINWPQVAQWYSEQT